MKTPETILHPSDDLCHLRDHLLSHICLQDFLLLPLTLHFFLQHINGLQQSLCPQKRSSTRTILIELGKEI